MCGPVPQALRALGNLAEVAAQDLMVDDTVYRFKFRQPVVSILAARGALGCGVSPRAPSAAPIWAACAGSSISLGA